MTTKYWVSLGLWLATMIAAVAILGCDIRAKNDNGLPSGIGRFEDGANICYYTISSAAISCVRR